jgi:hypothetical protein
MAIHNPKNERLEQCRVYRVIYRVIGRNSRLLTVVVACVVAIDVADLVDQIRRTCLGVEFTGTTTTGEFFHEVAEGIEIESAQLVGRLHGITDTAYRIITICDAQEKEEPPSVGD